MSKNQEKIKAALNRIEDCLATINTDEDWLKFLSFQAQFYNYSFGNAMLIFSQNPNATYVKGYKAWNQLGRYVKKGSKGLAILAPCIRKVEVFKEPENKNLYHDEEAEKEIRKVVSGFRIAYVYDIADTDGDDSMLPVLVTGLAGNSDEEKLIYERLYDYISKKNKLTKDKIGKIKNAFSTNEDLSVDEIRAILYEKSNTIKQVYFSLTETQIASYFPKGYTMQQMEEVILTLLDEWSKKEKR